MVLASQENHPGIMKKNPASPSAVFDFGRAAADFIEAERRLRPSHSVKGQAASCETQEPRLAQSAGLQAHLYSLLTLDVRPASPRTAWKWASCPSSVTKQVHSEPGAPAAQARLASLASTALTALRQPARAKALLKGTSPCIGATRRNLRTGQACVQEHNRARVGMVRNQGPMPWPRCSRVS